MRLRLANKEDFGFFYELKSEEYNIFWTGGNDKPQKDRLKEFFNNAIDKAKEPDARKIYIIENDEGEKVGHQYIIPNGEEYDLATAICERFAGRGYGKTAIMLGLDEGRKMGYKRMVGSIREDNIASMKAYSACGVKVLDEYREVYIPQLDKNVKMYVVVYEHEKEQ